MARLNWRMGAKTTAIAVVSGVVLATGAAFYAMHTAAADGDNAGKDGKLSKNESALAELSPESRQAIGYARDLSRAFRETANRVLPSVVTIRGEFGSAMGDRSGRGIPSQPSPERGRGGNQIPPEFEDAIPPQFRPFFRNPGGGGSGGELPFGRRQGVSMGSGVVIDERGVILTNNHVVSNADRIIVMFDDEREFTATDVKCDPQTDLAIVWIEGATDLVAAPLGDSDLIEVGDWVLALGNPFGRLSGSVTAGIVSAKDRNLGIADRESFIQTDAAINPGNSGGPLVNLMGEVIGINTAISSGTGNFAGVGLAIPSNNVKWVADQLKATGSVKRAYLGIEIAKVTAEIASKHGLKPGEGVVVGRVREDSPAAKGGLEPDDVILKFSDTTVNSPDSLQSIVERAEAGKTYPMEILRGTERKTLNVVALERPQDFTRRATGGGNAPSQEGQLGELGLEVRTLTPDLAKQLDVDADTGVVVTAVRPNSPAALAGIQPGSVILEVNRTEVKTAEEMVKIVSANARKRILLKIRSSEGTWLQSIDWSGAAN